MDLLPEEILLNILKHIDLISLNKINQTNRSIHNIIPFKLFIKKFAERYYQYANTKSEINFLKIVSNDFDNLLYINELIPSINIFDIAAQYGHADFLIKFKENYNMIKGTNNAFDLAALNGKNDILLLLKKEFPDIKGTEALINAYVFAARGGFNETIILLNEQFKYIKINDFAFDEAAINGQSHTLLLFKELFPNLHGSMNIFEKTAYASQSNVLKLFTQEFINLIPDKKYTQSIFESALARGDINIMKVIKYDYIPKNLFFTMYGTFKEYDELIKKGDIDTIIFLKKEFPKITGIINKLNLTDLYIMAASKGRNDIILYLKSINPNDLTTDVFNVAILNGHISTVELIINEFPKLKITEKAYENAGVRNRFDILKLLFENFNTELSNKTVNNICNMAVKRGFVDMLLFFINNYKNIKISSEAFESAVEFNRDEILIIIAHKILNFEYNINDENNNDENNNDEIVNGNYGKYGNININNISRYNSIDQLIRNKQQIKNLYHTNPYCIAAKYNYDTTIMILNKEFPSIQCTSDVYYEAAKSGNNNIILLIKKLFPLIGCTIDAFKIADQKSNISTIKILEKEFPDVYINFIKQKKDIPKIKPIVDAHLFYPDVNIGDELIYDLTDDITYPTAPTTFYNYYKKKSPEKPKHNDNSDNDSNNSDDDDDDDDCDDDIDSEIITQYINKLLKTDHETIRNQLQIIDDFPEMHKEEYNNNYINNMINQIDLTGIDMEKLSPEIILKYVKKLFKTDPKIVRQYLKQIDNLPSKHNDENNEDGNDSDENNNHKTKKITYDLSK